MFVLASSSPRRKELLQTIGLSPEQILHPEVDESPHEREGVREYVKRIARLKALSIHSKVPHAYVLSADTIVEIGRKIVGKPVDQEDAFQILQRLSGRRHRVYTGICGISPEGKIGEHLVLTRVSFKRLSENEIKEYLESKDWQGRAGAYSIQGLAAKFVKFISGSYTNVVGLPLYETDCLLKGLGFRG